METIENYHGYFYKMAEIPTVFPDLVIVGKDGEKGNVFAHLPRGLEAVIVNNKWVVEPVPILRESFRIDQLGSYVLGNFVDGESFTGSVKFNGAIMEVKYILRRRKPFTYTVPPTVYHAGDEVVLDLARIPDSDARFEHLMIGGRVYSYSSTICTHHGKFSISPAGVLSGIASGSGKVELVLYYVSRDAFQCEMRAPLTLIFFTDNMIRQSSLQPFSFCVPCNVSRIYTWSQTKVRTTATVSYSGASCGYEVLEGTRISVAYAKEPIVFAALLADGTVDLRFLQLYSPVLTRRFLISKVATRKVSWEEALEVPHEACRGLGAKMLKVASKCGQVSVDDDGITFETSGILGSWYTGASSIVLNDSLAFNFYATTIDIPVLKKFVRCAPSPGAPIELDLPREYRIISVNCSPGVEHSGVGGAVFVAARPGVYTAKISYEIFGDIYTLECYLTFPAEVVVERTYSVEHSICVRGTFVAGRALEELETCMRGLLGSDGALVVECPGLLRRDDTLVFTEPCQIAVSRSTGVENILIEYSSRTSVAGAAGSLRDIPPPEYLMVIDHPYMNLPAASLENRTFGVIQITQNASGAYVAKLSEGASAGPWRTPVDSSNAAAGMVTFVPMASNFSVFMSISGVLTINIPNGIDAYFESGTSADIHCDASAVYVNLSSITLPETELLLVSGNGVSYHDPLATSGTSGITLDNGVFSACQITFVEIQENVSLGLVDGDIVLSHEITSNPNVTIALAPGSSSGGGIFKIASGVVSLVAPGTNADIPVVPIVYLLSLPVPSISSATGVFLASVSVRANIRLSPPLMVSSKNPSLAKLRASAMLLFGPGGEAVTSVSGIGIYTCWYVVTGVSDELRVCVVNSFDVQQTVQISVQVGIAVALRLGSEAYSYVDEDVAVELVGGRGTALAKSVGTFEVVIDTRYLLVIVASARNYTWKCRASAFGTLPYIVPLPFAGGAIRTSLSYISRGTVLEITTDESTGTITIDGPSQPTVINCTFLRLSAPLFSSKVLSGTISMTDTLGAFPGSSVVYLSLDGNLAIDSDVVIEDSPIATIADNIYVGTTAQIVGMLRQIPGGSIVDVLAYDHTAGDVYFKTYYASAHQLGCAVESGENSYDTYNGPHVVDAGQRKITVQRGDVIDFVDSGTVCHLVPPNYDPTETFAVDLVERAPITFTALNAFAPDHDSVVFPKAFSRIGTYNFASGSYVAGNGGNSTGVDIIHAIVKTSIFQYESIYWAIKIGDLVEKNGTYNATAQSGVLVTIPCNSTLRSIYVVAPVFKWIPLVDGETVVVTDDITVTPRSPNKISIVGSPTIIWSTRVSFGTLKNS
jgi:hypothetical protein